MSEFDRDHEAAEPIGVREAAARRTAGTFPRGLLGALIAIALVVAVAGGGAQQAIVALQRPAADLSTTTATALFGLPATQPDTAVQQVIEQANNAQAQAFAANDPSVMAATATADYYQQMVQTNQDLRDHGVAAIALASIDWGAVSVNGSTATATAYETWTTTMGDSTTEVSRDENDYTLVLDQGSWKIQADDHPSVQAGTSGGGTPIAPAVPPGASAPTPPAGASTSHNWSGYAASGGTYSAVTGTWTVPAFVPVSAAGGDATWVGIGGVTTRDLIQAGTQELTSGSGQTQYSAWIETLPQPSHPVPLVVRPGDSITVSIAEQSANVWLVALTNNTTGQSYQDTEQYSSSHSSAEWVQEAPSATHGGLLPLDGFGVVDFSAATATRDGRNVTLEQAGAQAIVMNGATNQALAVPSAPGADGSSFSVTRTAASAIQPGPPNFPRGRRFGS